MIHFERVTVEEDGDNPRRRLRVGSRYGETGRGIPCLVLLSLLQLSGEGGSGGDGVAVVEEVDFVRRM